MRTKRATFAWLVVCVMCLTSLWPDAAAAQGGTTYTVQAGDSLGYIAQTYGTTIDAIMQANGLASPDMVWVGQTLTIPVQSTPRSAAGGAPGANTYSVQIGDTIASIAAQLGVSSTALAETNGLTDPDLLWVGQQLRVPGSALGSAITAPPPQAATSSGAGSYTVQPGDTLRSIAAQLGVTTTALAEANDLTNADLLLVGQTLALPGSQPSTGSGSPAVPTTAPAAPTVSPTIPTAEPAATGANAGQYIVQPGDTLNIIAQKLGVTTAALAAANGLANADLLAVGQSLIVPGAAGAPTEVAVPTTAPQATAAATPGAATPENTGGRYVVRPGDTLNSIAARLGISAGALAQENGLTDVDVLMVGQTLSLPGSEVAPVIPEPTPVASDSPPAQIRYTVKRGDTLGIIARKYNISAAAIARANQISRPDLVSVGTTLLIPSPAWTAPDFSGTPSRFVASIALQRCWLYQGNRVVADWPCSSGQPGTETHPGSYKIQSKLDRAFGSTWNIWMPYWLGIYWAGASENGIHGIPYSASNNNWRLWEGFVGTPVTYGCILLDDVHAKQLYDIAYIGMPVIIQP